ncbi:predicted protein [Nematostella vectensis]|uniref:Integrase catalytic domain-containing protein n=1 Tax=Nematostella vectensis TaxID=45351 RepID=A7RZD2_NEMVE|nr:predicted protein [Nematostella vectensis]|eukprot:XP_001635319.1 predicted protein [Nematostella vectensis]
MSSCYWHKKLTDAASLLCTFNTPFGRFRFRRMPFGISCASEVAQKMVEEHFGDIEGVLPVYDDIIVSGKTEAEMTKHCARYWREPETGTLDSIRRYIIAWTRHGYPETITADNNPFNSVEMNEYANQCGFKTIHTSPLYSQSNGLAEKAVGIVKSILGKGSNLNEGLMVYRNTPEKYVLKH